MAKLEALKQGAQVKGIDPAGVITVINVKWFGSDVVELTYRDQKGQPHTELLYRDREADLDVLEAGIPWAFNADGELFRLVSEAYRIRMAYLFDPWMAVHLSLVEPLPHQISAVYGEMLPRQPLRFLLADDPGAGKTIMTGLFIKELMLRGDLDRCLVVAPGNLVEQWQDELYQRFHLPFELLTNDRISAARTGNALQEMNLVIARLDKLSRDEELHAKLGQTEWDLIVVDEAHKMSASVFGGEIKYTKRYHLGQILTQRARHVLLLTATPHNGKEEDFQLFLALLDSDRFEGRYREGVHEADASDLMRRLVKEQLLKFDGTPLFPERRAYTVTYKLSDLEAALYEQVTSYVRDEFNRAESLESGRKGTVGFALTILQRRLASSPEAIYQSLRRRRERLESRLRETRLLKRGAEAQLETIAEIPMIDEDNWEDLEDAPEDEVEQTTEQVLDLATAARTIAELEAEIQTLRELETLAEKVRRSGIDRKWNELSRLLQEQSEMFDNALTPNPSSKMGEGSPRNRRKLVIFSEHRDTLNYLTEKIRSLIGKPEAVVTIHGGIPRDQRRGIQASFVQDKDVFVLVATDAAGEGINLQRAHLMINYDLPWNPTRLEQRFGRIHRIGQTEVCHLWNLVAEETREGDVYIRLLEKIEQQRQALGDGVFDVLGNLFQEVSLRKLLLEAIRYGDQPEVRERLYKAVDNAADQKRVRELLADYSLARDSLDTTQVQHIREEFERAQARRLQPHFVAAFFKAAFERLGGTMYARESKRYEITRVPAVVRERSRLAGSGIVLPRYERITFHKEEINLPGKPTAEFLCPGHPLMDSVIDLMLERYRQLLRSGAYLVDPNDPGEEIRALFYLEHSILAGGDSRHAVSRQMQFVEIAPTPDPSPKMGEGSSATKMGEGSSATKMGEGSSATKMGEGSSATKMGEGSSATKMGEGSSATKMGEGSSATKMDEGSSAINTAGPGPHVTPKTGEGSSAINMAGSTPILTPKMGEGSSTINMAGLTPILTPKMGEGSFTIRMAGPAPFLDYEPLKEEYREFIDAKIGQANWLREDLENRIVGYAVQQHVPEHLGEVKTRRAEMIDRTYSAVKDRLTKEIAYWDHRAEELKAQEQSGKFNARLNSEMARRRADDLQGRLQRRLVELDQDRRIAPQPPVVIGGALVIPAGLLARLEGRHEGEAGLYGREGRNAVEKAAMQAVMEQERSLGYIPVDVSAAKLGWDIESRIPGTGRLRFIEVKGRTEGATTITVSKNEILAGLNKPEDFILAVVEVKFEDGKVRPGRISSIQKPFRREPDFAATSVNYDWKEMMELEESQ